MNNDVKKAIKTLGNHDVGWVNRRDAVEQLAAAARDSLKALHAHKDDSDRDVQGAVAKALNSLGLDVPAPVDDETSLGKLVEALHRPNRREVRKTETGFEVTVQTKKDRSQTVSIEATVSNTKQNIVRVSTTCAPATDDVYEWALTNNSKMSHCALAIEERDGKRVLVLVNNHLAEGITFRELKLTVKEVALYGDWVEETITGADEH